MSQKYRHIIILILLVLPERLSAQESLPIRNFTHIEYQAQQQNWSIAQSLEGLIYVGNSEGLLEYDGASWYLYPFANGQPVRSVLCDGARIYAGGYGEFGYWEKNQEDVLQYYSISALGGFASAESEEIWHILKGTDGIFFQSFSRIYQFTGPTPGKPHHLKEIRAPQNFMFLQEVNGKMLLPFIDHEIFEMREDRFEALPGTETLSGGNVSAILPYGREEVMIVTSKNGIYIWNSGVIRKWSPEKLTFFENDIVNKAIRLRDGTYAFGTQLSGVYIVSSGGEILHRFNTANGLQNNSVLGLFQDRQNHLWVALDKGIDLVALSSPISLYKSDEMPLEATYAVALWRNKLYAGTNRGVFWKRWPSNESFQPIPGLEGHVWELKTYDDQLICGHSDGTFLITENGFERLSALPGGWTTMLASSGNEKILIQGTYTGLSVYRLQTNGKWKFSNKVDSIPPLPFKYIAQSSNGTLWLAHAHKGLFKARLREDARAVSDWQPVTTPTSLANSYNIEIINWKGQPIIKSGNQYFRPDHLDRLQLDTSLPVQAESSSKLRAGIDGDFLHVFPNYVVLEAAGGKTAHIPVALIRNHETIISIADRYYFFCTHNGYFIYDRQHPATSDSTIVPVLRRVSDQQDPSKSFPGDSKIVVPAGSRAITIDFAMPVYGESVQFCHRLKGLSTAWSDWTQRRSVSLFNLQPGIYTFELRNSYNSRTLEFQIEILPFWHESGWMRLAIILLVAIGLLGLYYLQENRLNRQKEKLTQEHEDKLKQKELANQKRIVELQNEKLASEINLKSQQLSNIAINVIRKNEILESIKNELIQVKNDLGQQLPNVHYQKLLDSITRNLSGKEDWTLFEENFDDIHEEFFRRLKHLHPGVSPGDLRLAAALRMNLSSKEMAPILGISVRGVEIKRYRLRRKLGLAEDVNLNSYMMEV